MNREIKFRAWDKGNQQMIYALPIGTLPSGELLLRWDDKHLMEFTGLKDINKKDIYEGDIIKYVGNFKGDIFISPVEFTGGCFSPVCEIGFMGDIIENKVEIIGNIYENSELLK